MKRLVASLILAACFSIGSAPAQAQEKFPSKPIKILVPFAPGGSVDIVARIVAEQMRQKLGQSVIVENKPGAFGIVALEELVRSKPDGYTLLMGNPSSNVGYPVFVPGKFKINVERDVIPVARLLDIPAFLIATTTNFDVKSVDELIAYAKKNPGKTRYGAPVANYTHFDMAYFAKKAGDLDMILIANKAGAGSIVNDLVTGDTQVAFNNVASSVPMIKAGKLRPLAVVNHQRLPEYPDVPTMQEIGMKDVGTIAWQALFAPAGTPKEVLQVLFDAAVQSLEVPAAREPLVKQHFNIYPSKSLEEAKTWLAGEFNLWRTITSAVKIQAEE